MQQTPSFKDIVLVGGGHTHVLFLKKWAMQAIPGVRVTLISPDAQTPYSGMLPGLVAGEYSFDETHIDLVRLCKMADARFIREKVTAINTQYNTLHIKGRSCIVYDIASIDIGSTPSPAPNNSSTNTNNYQNEDSNNPIIPVKPISNFLPQLKKFHEYLEYHTQNNSSNNNQISHNKNLSVAVVGGGAGGVELCLALHSALNKNHAVKLHLISRQDQILKGYPDKLRHTVEQHFLKNRISLYKNFAVNSIDDRGLVSSRGEHLPANRIFWCTAATAARWPKESKLDVNTKGFINVSGTLQTLTASNVFACGDCANFIEQPLAKAGVYAVRQAPILFENICRLLLQKPLKHYRPQKNFLSLLSLSNGTAIGAHSSWSFSGAWVWHWKNHIDKKFMASFSDLSLASHETMNTAEIPAVITNSEEKNQLQDIALRCGGCGAKVAHSVLHRVLSSIKQETPINGSSKNIHCGLQQNDDAAVFSIAQDKLLVQSIDQLRLFMDDLYLFGKIAANHALSDLFAMNATPHSAQTIVSLPYSSEKLVERDLHLLLSGAQSVLTQHGCELIGGHTSEATDTMLGFNVNGLADEESLLHTRGAQAGDHIILTKALGTGAIFAAQMRGKAKGQWLDAATQMMLQSNAISGYIFSQYKAHACTDVTGFGLLGHLHNILQSSACGAQIQIDSLPCLDGIRECFEEGIFSSLHGSNARLQRSIDNGQDFIDHPLFPLLFDPQTSGGLLACIPAQYSDLCLQNLHKAGLVDSCIIGTISDEKSTAVEQRISLIN